MMTINMPQIEINFVKAAETALKRSERGVVCLILSDTTDEGFRSVKYTKASEVEAAKFTAANAEIIKSAFLGNPECVYVVRFDKADETIAADLADTLSAIKFNWAAAPVDTATQAALKTWLQGFNSSNPNHQRKAVLYNTDACNDMHIVNFATTAMTMADSTSSVTAAGYTARIAGLLAGLPMTESATYKILDDVKSVTEPADLDAAVNGGKLILFNDEGVVRVARGVNSLTTTTTSQIEAMKKIAVVETMDLIKADISRLFKDSYCGRFRNSADNQALFVAAINSYFEQLVNEGILDENGENKAEIDVNAQRLALAAIGKDVKEWDDNKVKETTVGANIYVKGSVGILDCIEDFVFNITMN